MAPQVTGTAPKKVPPTPPATPRIFATVATVVQNSPPFLPQASQGTLDMSTLLQQLQAIKEGDEDLKLEDIDSEDEGERPVSHCEHRDSTDAKAAEVGKLVHPKKPAPPPVKK